MAACTGAYEGHPLSQVAVQTKKLHCILVPCSFFFLHCSFAAQLPAVQLFLCNLKCCTAVFGGVSVSCSAALSNNTGLSHSKTVFWEKYCNAASENGAEELQCNISGCTEKAALQEAAPQSCSAGQISTANKNCSATFSFEQPPGARGSLRTQELPALKSIIRGITGQNLQSKAAWRRLIQERFQIHKVKSEAARVRASKNSNSLTRVAAYHFGRAVLSASQLLLTRRCALPLSLVLTKNESRKKVVV